MTTGSTPIVLAGYHSALLVGFSITIAILASYTALDLASRLHASMGRARKLWLGGASLVLGSGIWAMHFIAMLAFHMPGMTIGYDPVLTVFSLILAVMFTGIGFAVSNRRRGPANLAVGGLLMGLGIVAMHYVGMTAMRMGAYLSYDEYWVGLSVLIAVAAATAALWLAAREQNLPARSLAAILMGTAISGMHYTGMRAALLTAMPDSHSQASAGRISQSGLAAGVIAITAMIVLIGWSAASVDRLLGKVTRREARTALRLRLAEALRDLGTDEALYETAALVGPHFGAERVCFGELDRSTGHLSYRICWTDGTLPPLLGNFPLSDFGITIVDAVSSGKTVAIEDLRSAGLSAAALLRPLTTKSGLIVPFLQEGHLHSTLYINSRRARRWTADEIAFAEEIAERTRQIIARGDAEKQLRDLNVTLERRIAEAVAEREALAAVVDNTSASVMVCDSDLTIMALNSAQRADFKRLFGQDCHVGDNLLSLLDGHAEAREKIHHHWKRALSGERFLLVEEFGHAEHDRAYFEVHFQPMRSKAGKIDGAFLTAYDVSDRIRAQRELEGAQEALRQSQKMESMGQLTGGVAHDFNNLLTPILGALDLLQRRGVGDDREKRLIAGALQSAERAKTLVQRLLAFARRQPLQTVSVDLGALIEGMADLVASTSGPQIKVIVDIPEDLPCAKADPNQLEMALLNLSVNARDAMTETGTLRISARAATMDEPSNDLQPGRYVCISVADTGTGMDEETMARAIEPFFSTKGIGRGTGLGLSMVHGLASQLNGALHITSKQGLGTNVELWLPECEGEENKHRSIAAPRPLRLGTALVVDDDKNARLSTAAMLEELGYCVVEANSAEDAIRIMERGDHFDLLLTDHLMPGMTGAELMDRVRTNRPDTPALLISGYAELEGLAANLPRLAKPFRKDDLAQSIGKL